MGTWKLTPRIKIDKHNHFRQHYKVHTLLNDFEVEDVWQVPVTLTSDQSLHLFVEHFKKATQKITDKGVAGFLFRLRLSLGKRFNLDDENKLVSELTPGSIRHRYAHEAALSFAELPAVGNDYLGFAPVYIMENEELAEIENKTVHAALHFSRVPIGEAAFGVYMAVYVKPKGLLGKIYMLLIKPFRWWIVYPALMKIAKNEWESNKVNGDSIMANDEIVEIYLKGLLDHLSEGDKVELSYASGATDHELAQLKRHYPQCPGSLIQLLSRINGTYWQKYGDHEITVLILGSDVFEYPYYLKSVDQILNDNEWRESIRDIYGDEIDEMPELVGEGIDPEVKIDQWLCFSDCMNNGGTSKLFLDFNPTSAGRSGQVVRFLHDPDSFRVIAKSFDEYLQMLIDKGYDFIHAE